MKGKDQENQHEPGVYVSGTAIRCPINVTFGKLKIRKNYSVDLYWKFLTELLPASKTLTNLIG